MYDMACVSCLFIDFIGLRCVRCSVISSSFMFLVCVLVVVCCVDVCCFIGLSCVYVLLLLVCFRFFFFVMV